MRGLVPSCPVLSRLVSSVTPGDPSGTIRGSPLRIRRDARGSPRAARGAPGGFEPFKNSTLFGGREGGIEGGKKVGIEGGYRGASVGSWARYSQFGPAECAKRLNNPPFDGEEESLATRAHTYLDANILAYYTLEKRTHDPRCRTTPPEMLANLDRPAETEWEEE